MSNNFIHSLNNTYQLTVDEKTIPFNVSISDIGDNKIIELREKYIKRLKKKDKIINWLFCIPILVMAAIFLIAIIVEMISESSTLYYIITWMGCILGCYGVIIMICQFFSNLFSSIHNGFKGWNAYRIASEIAFALNNIEPDSEIKLIKDVVKQTDPDIYLQIKDNDTKRINTYWLDSYSWEVHDDKEEIDLIAQRINIDDTTGNEPVYKMKLLVPQWVEDEYIVGRNLFA